MSLKEHYIQIYQDLAKRLISHTNSYLDEMPFTRKILDVVIPIILNIFMLTGHLVILVFILIRLMIVYTSATTETSNESEMFSGENDTIPKEPSSTAEGYSLWILILPMELNNGEDQGIHDVLPAAVNLPLQQEASPRYDESPGIVRFLRTLAHMIIHLNIASVINFAKKADLNTTFAFIKQQAAPIVNHGRWLAENSIILASSMYGWRIPILQFSIKDVQSFVIDVYDENAKLPNQQRRQRLHETLDFVNIAFEQLISNYPDEPDMYVNSDRRSLSLPARAYCIHMNLIHRIFLHIQTWLRFCYISKLCYYCVKNCFLKFVPNSVKVSAKKFLFKTSNYTNSLLGIDSDSFRYAFTENGDPVEEVHDESSQDENNSDESEDSAEEDVEEYNP